MTADKLIVALHLKELPWEGGYYRETWRSTVDIPSARLSPAYEGSRTAGTAIYYLLTPETVSRMHRLPSDETFHFYLGDPTEMLLLHPGGAGDVVRLGQDIFGGEYLQLTVPGNTWMGGRIANGGRAGFSLMGTTVSPGFDFRDLEMGDAEALAREFPEHAALLAGLA